MGTDAIFGGNNARPHRARLARIYLENETIPQMAWPARSSDLNPIEHVWPVVKTDCSSQCAARNPPRAPTSLTTRMCITVTKSDTIASMPRRCQVCIQQSVVPIAHSAYEFSLSCRYVCTICVFVCL
ncbi:hypothetical protein AVEN_3441-1 [Araneus ventricosus]|uniref:Tc1-like transposase DDE domain-containing protein n=1 Tax=Araneus ventricosus TaxID=182803 RepID=A0A4Y2KD52_ARAVE|nr:hypothetical protein AVEN_3441-1 [Araneus ventricosus]